MYAQITAQPNLIIIAHWTTTAPTSTYEQYSPSQLRWWRAQHIIANIASFFLKYICVFLLHSQYIFLFILWENWNCCNNKKTKENDNNNFCNENNKQHQHERMDKNERMNADKLCYKVTKSKQSSIKKNQIVWCLCIFMMVFTNIYAHQPKNAKK